jgi:iron complex outermembrane receptor protein
MAVKPLFYAFLGTTALATSAAALAQDAESAAGAAVADQAVANQEAIIVTARRREERLQDVPLSITAISSEELSSRNVVSTQELQQLSPSVNFTPVNGRGTSVGLSIRGQRQLDQAITFDPSVGVYLNEVYQARPAGFDTMMFDLESVQILKGPQGTLFGRNTTAGAVLFQTRGPGDEFGGYIRANIEDPEGYQLEGAVDLPLAPGVAIRAAGRYINVEGYTPNLQTGQRLDDRNRWGGRITLDINPSSGFQNTTVVDYFESDEDGVAYFPAGYNQAFVTAFLANFPAPTAAYLGSIFTQFSQDLAAQPALGRAVSFPTIQDSHAESFGISNTTTIQLSDDVQLKNIIGYRSVDQYDRLDLDGANANLIASDQVQDTEGWSEELQLSGTAFDGALDWLVGAYYFNESGEEEGTSWSFSPIVPTPGRRIYFTGENTSVSIFAQSTYTLPFEDRTRISAGIRYTWDERQATPATQAFDPMGNPVCLVEGSPAGSCGVDLEADFDAASWVVSIDHEFVPDTMAYASISRGYRTGGIDGRAQSLGQQTPFAPEYVTAYELGLRSSFDLGGARVYFSGDVFYQKYSDIQRLLAVLLPGNNAPATVALNAARANIKGAEAELSVQVTPTFQVGALYGYLDASYSEFQSNFLGDLSGNRFTYSPKNTFGANMSWDIVSSGFGDLNLSASYYHTSSYFIQDVNTPFGLMPAYDIVNASLTLDNIAGSDVSVQLYAKNLFNERYTTAGLDFSGSLGYSAFQRGLPRIFGLSVRLPFGAER